ncbi:hypothetical protein GGE16_001626 [Rhizobium leguminosarum]|uniref:Uncharacterized protein n=1 Tax=Rhizobium leguminosarum TaxID=384 RepID=A0AAE2SVH9_RHILE|nr:MULTISPECIES: hypothetical protein [Rhizobium]MBB4289586.1 hypothetical protein [Rhizobium leguminosarum]MBB4296230.1 hypothetical protein [Rhizobium leguminosarum]MBB4308510.1 hypothetical protein [Rhizobium leguminosarum]MBB4416346.1 hypothetical protein [Rhizobium leguminosarum]MBB4430687.1 hypothetical protein [Rhizobium esperanzae]
MASHTSSEDASRAKKAVARFSQDYLDGSIPPIAAVVDRDHYASLLGLDAGDLRKLLDDHQVIDLGQSDLQDRFWSERVVLAAFLHCDMADGKLARNANGGLLRSRYLSLFRSVQMSSSRYRLVFTSLECHLSQPAQFAPLSQRADEIEAWFSERFAEQSLDVRRGKASRRQAYDAFGVSIRVKVSELEAPLQRWSERIVAENYEPDPLKVRQCLAIAGRPFQENRKKKPETVQLRANLSCWLQRDLEAGTLVMMKNRNQVSRLHYAKVLNCKISSVRGQKDILAHFDVEAGKVRGIIGTKIGEVREWLRNHLENRTLQVFKGEVCRQQLAAAFGVSLRDIRTSTEISELLVEYGEKAIGIEGLPSRRTAERTAHKAAEEAHLREYVNGERVTLFRGKISRRAAAAAIGVSTSALDRTALKTILETADERIVGEFLSKPGNFFHNGTPFDFARITALGFSEALSVALSETFREALQEMSFKRAFDIYGVALVVFEAATPHAHILYESDGSLAKGSEYAWTRVLASLRATSAARSTRVMTNAFVGFANHLIKLLKSSNLMPSGVRPLKKLSAVEKTQLRTVVEAPTLGKSAAPVTTNSVQRYIELLEAVVLSVDAGMDAKQVPEFVSAVARQAQADASLKNDPVEAVKTVLRERLDAASEAGWQTFCKWREHFDYGQGLIANVEREAGEDERLQDIFVKGPASPHLHLILPEEFSEAALARFLFIMKKYNGSVTSDWKNQRLRKRLARLYGRWPLLQAYLVPHVDSSAATVLACLASKGPNTAVGRELPTDFTRSVDDEIAEIVGIKRKGGAPKVIHIDLPAKGREIEMLDWMKAATQHLRGSSSWSSRLFLVCHNRRIRPLSETTTRDHIRKICQTTPMLVGLNIVPSMFRTSRLLLQGLLDKGLINVSRALAGHTEDVAWRDYHSRPPETLIRDAVTRSYLTDAATLIVHDDNELANALGISDEALAERRRSGRMRRTGFGTLCGDTLGRPGSVGTPCTHQDCERHCPQLLFVADPVQTALVQAWGIGLRSAEDEFSRTRPERWVDVWLPRLKLIESIEELMTRGQNINIWDEATILREQIWADPSTPALRPW